MFYPIPTGCSLSQTATARRPKTECWGSETKKVTASIQVKASATAHERQPNVEVYEVDRPLSGKWSEKKKSGIHMTPMSVLNETRQYSIGTVTHVVYDWSVASSGATYPSTKVDGRCLSHTCESGPFHDDRALAVVEGSYVEQGDLRYFKAKYPDIPHYRIDQGVDASLLEKRQAEAYSELFQSYNLGEELYELKDSLVSIKNLMNEGIKILTLNHKYFKVFRGLRKKDIPKSVLKEASSRWMEFRYGIMPIVYSIQDILGVFNEKGLYRTIRKRINSKSLPPPNHLPKRYFVDYGLFQQTATITAKAEWSTVQLKNFDLINVNPLTTAIEVFPYAMVIRWFVNLSSFANARIKSLTSVASSYKACTAIKTTAGYGTYLVFDSSYDVQMNHRPNSTCGSTYYPEVNFGRLQNYSVSMPLLAYTRINNYTRYLFNPSDIKLVFSPFLDWKRLIDGFILGGRRVSKLL